MKLSLPNTLFKTFFFTCNGFYNFRIQLRYLTQLWRIRWIAKLSLTITIGILIELMVLPGFAHTNDSLKGGSIDLRSDEYPKTASISSLKDGLWTDPTVWSVGRVPTIGDEVLLLHTVSIPSGIQAKVKHLLYESNGHLVFEDVTSKLQFYDHEPRFRLKKAYFGGLRYYSSTTYTYNSQGQLISYIFRTGSSSLAENSTGYSTVLTYDGQGRLVRVEGQPGDNYLQRFDYSYDTNGRINSVSKYNDIDHPGTFDLKNTYALEYTINTVPIKVTNTSTTISPYQVSTEQYTYSNGNIIKIESNDGVNSVRIQNFPVTNKPNPFYGLVTGAPSYSTYSINLLLSPTFNDIDTYDLNGYLIKRIEQVGGPVDNEYRYEYEAY